MSVECPYSRTKSRCLYVDNCKDNYIDSELVAVCCYFPSIQSNHYTRCIHRQLQSYIIGESSPCGLMLCFWLSFCRYRSTE